MGPGSAHLVWVTARAAGITALLLSSASLSLGLLMSLAPRRGKDWRTVHEALGLATLAAIGLHGLAIFADPWLKPGLAGVLVPLHVSYRPPAVAAGIIAGYGLLALGLGYYVRDRIGPSRWRSLHRWTALFWMMAVGHAFIAGTDRAQIWFIASVGSVSLVGVALILKRVSSREGAPAAPAARPSRATPSYSR